MQNTNSAALNQKTSTNPAPWSEVKARIKGKFGKFTEENLESLKDHMDQLPARIQSVYGYEKSRAESESVAFLASLKSPHTEKKTEGAQVKDQK